MRKTYMMLLALVLTMLGVSDAMAQAISLELPKTRIPLQSPNQTIRLPASQTSTRWLVAMELSLVVQMSIVCGTQT